MSSSIYHPKYPALTTPVDFAQETFSLDYYLSRLLGLGWLRRNTPSESPNLTPMVCPRFAEPLTITPMTLLVGVAI